MTTLTTNEGGYPFADRALAQRLERTEAGANAAFVEARAHLHPGSGAEWTEVAGAYAMFDGAGSPLTQSFGLGVFALPTEEEMERLEAFFRERGAEVMHEVSPLADPRLLEVLGARGYRPIEFSSVLFRPVAGPALGRAPDARIRVRRTEEGEAALWGDVSAGGWGETPELSEFMRQLGATIASSRGYHTFLAELDGRPVAAGAVFIGEGVALLAGASTLPEARGRGAQLALLDARLRFAAEHGCTLAMMGASPGSASQRNAERQGFRIAYTRTKWHLPAR